jgi:hypothetical protein
VTTSTLDQGLETAAPSRSAARGWIDGALTLPDELPGPTWAWHVIFPVALLVAAHVPIWVSGVRAFGDPEPYVFVPVFVTAYTFAFIAALRNIAGSAFEQFRPALGDAGSLEAGWKRDLTTIPDRTAIVAIVIALLGVNAAFFGGPNSTAFSTSVVVNVVGTTLWEVAIVLGAIAVAFALQQLRAVSRLHDLAQNVDVLEPRPINAFSRLTAATASGLLLVAVLMVTPSSSQVLSSLLTGGALIVVAVASFVLPLRGMHARLVAERDALVAAMHLRLRVTIDRIHAMVDTDDTARADELQKTLDSLLAERDLLMKLPTWPWSASTFRGITTAVVLPIALWLVFRLLERVV